MSRQRQRIPTEWMNDDVVVVRDDDRDGWRMTITRGNDGDFWISLAPDYRDIDEDERDLYASTRIGSIRIRAGSIGGGEHENLYRALAGYWKDVDEERRAGHKRDYSRNLRAHFGTAESSDQVGDQGSGG